ncbi:TonB-dependent receptor [Tunicatimonas pelagia]|uniref:TonB-dependent receptor n=1 Tax=Tunicatimonas pelagia TaxID=931531 RepID=UPI0026664100|nr:TonB-dependent receptor [Tunicatimonas pelagia]WKN44165.1 TonB-dependent receptor [Tunicatimonas pelagia]
MKKIIIGLCLIGLSGSLYAQHRFTAIVKDHHSQEPLVGATAQIKGDPQGQVADVNGQVQFDNLPKGSVQIVFRFVGYEDESITLQFPEDDGQTRTIELHSHEEELEEITVTSTRSSRTIADVPTRVEIIAGEELDEKANMKPGDIRMLLNESTGIQTQQTSATSANSSIRIQGLEGRYTQLLRDGFPLYAGFSGGLSIMQIPPLDLQQVEVIKGSSSTLYGGGAIAGLVNLISRRPTEERVTDFMVNLTSAGGLDLSGFYGKKWKKYGLTVFASRNSNAAYDPTDIGLTAIPQFERYTLNPTLYWYPSEATEVSLALNLSTEDRLGGDLQYIEEPSENSNRYFERNDTRRTTSQFSLTHRFNEQKSLVVKSSFNVFDRDIEIPDYRFTGYQLASFSEVNYQVSTDKLEWIAGLNLWTDRFRETSSFVPERDQDQTIVGGFVQSTYLFSEQFTLEAGLRGDYVVDYGWVALPRISALLKVSPQLTSRLGGGLGYKTPSIFTEEAEEQQFQQVLPIVTESTALERSIGGNWDINYRTGLFQDQMSLSINHLFFVTQLTDPLLLTRTAEGLFAFRNADGYVLSRGMETNLKLQYQHFKLFIGYTLADVKQHFGDEVTPLPLTAQHRLNNVLVYEVHGKGRIGLEAYYFSPQPLSDGTTGQSYWICGLMMEKVFSKFSLFLNLENFLDTRQTRFDTIFTGSVTDPTFRDIYAPVDGFVVNGGVKLSL